MQADSVEYVVYHVMVSHSVEVEGFAEDSRVLVGPDVPAAFNDAPETQPCGFQRRGFFSRGSC